MIKELNILDEKENILHQKSIDVTFPMNLKDKNLIQDMLEHLRDSQDDALAEEFDLRPGMGLAAVQLGVLKRYFVISYKQEDDSFIEYIVINPKIVSHSEEQIFAGTGEGCLSVNRETEGIVPRYARVTVDAVDMNGNPIKYRVREEIAIAFQHEIDHLDGILFVDRIDKNNPFRNVEKMREI